MSDQLDLFEDYAAAIHHGDGGKGGTQTATPGEPQAFAVLKRKRALTEYLMEEVTRPANLTNACQQVFRNGGAPGIDGMTVEELGPWLIKHQEELEQKLLNGRYTPRPVRTVEIPKPGGFNCRCRRSARSR